MTRWLKPHWLLLGVTGTLSASPPLASDPTAADIASAYQRSNQRDGLYLHALHKGGPLEGLYKADFPIYLPDIRDISCTNKGNNRHCTYKMVYAVEGNYRPCRGALERTADGWAFSESEVIPPLREDQTDLPSRRDDQICSAAYRPMDYVAPTRRVGPPTVQDFRKLYRFAFAPHAISSCRNRVRNLQCSPVADDRAQFDCRYDDKHVGAKVWISRRTRVEYDSGWAFAEGDEPKCTIVGWDMGEGS